MHLVSWTPARSTQASAKGCSNSSLLIPALSAMRSSAGCMDSTLAEAMDNVSRTAVCTAGDLEHTSCTAGSAVMVTHDQKAVGQSQKNLPSATAAQAGASGSCSTVGRASGRPGPTEFCNFRALPSSRPPTGLQVTRGLSRAARRSFLPHPSPHRNEGGQCHLCRFRNKRQPINN